ncbi:MAG: glycosyltransferase family 2 protein, partial [Candidatus Micrarchaeota archaeon]
GRNAGARHAKGDVILFNDADTIPDERYYARLQEIFLDPKVVGAGCKIMPGEATKLQRFVFEMLNLMVWMSVKVGRPAIAGNSVAYRKDAFFKIKGFDEEMQASEDQDLCIRISKFGKVVYLNDLTAYTDSRRLKKFGLIGLFFDWGKTTFNFVTGQKNRRYAIVREI